MAGPHRRHEAGGQHRVDGRKSLTVYPHQVYDACSYSASIAPRTAVEVTITVSQPSHGRLHRRLRHRRRRPNASIVSSPIGRTIANHATVAANGHSVYNSGRGSVHLTVDQAATHGSTSSAAWHSGH